MKTNLRGDWLVTFVAVVEAGSFTRAAQRLHRTQSAVSMQIQQLETAANHQLLIRDRTGVVPTAAGEQLLRHARKVSEAMSDAAHVFDNADVAAGILRVGIPEEYAGTALPKLLSQFQRRQPRVQLQITCASSDQLARGLKANALDLGVLVEDRGYREGKPLLYDPTLWVMSGTFELPADGELPLVLFDQQCWWRQWALDRVQETGAPWRIAYTSGSIFGVAAAISAGLGIGVLGQSTLPGNAVVVPEGTGLPTLPGSHLILHVVNPEAPGASDMAGRIEAHFKQARGHD